MAFLPLQASKLSNFKISSIYKQFAVTKIQIFSFREEKCLSAWSYDKSSNKNVPLGQYSVVRHYPLMNYFASELEFQCTRCESKYPQKTSLILHIASAHGLKCLLCTGKSFSKALILASTNPKYDKRLSSELPFQYMKIPSSEYVVYIIILNIKTEK